MNKIKDFFSWFPVVLMFGLPFILGILFPTPILCFLVFLYFLGSFKIEQTGWGALGSYIFAGMGILAAIGTGIGFLFSFLAQ